MADVYTRSKRSEIMARVKSRKTTPEEQVAVLLRKLKIRHQRNVRSLPGEPDFVVRSAQTAVFVHGCFWHNHCGCNRAKLPNTNKSFWKKKIEGNRRRDARIQRRLRKEGWHVLTIWQCALRKPDRVLKRLERVFCGG